MPSPRHIISVDASGKVQSVEYAEMRKIRLRLNRLAWLLDSAIPIPGTRFTFGLEALIGVVPLLGDLIGALLSSYIVSEAARLGAPKLVLMRMGFNIGAESIIGIIPIVGDLFDAAWKANQRNVRLLNEWLDQPVRTERSSRGFGLLVAFVLVAFISLLGIGIFLLLRSIFGNL